VTVISAAANSSGPAQGFGPLQCRRQQPDGLLPPAARQPVTVERDAQAQYRCDAVRVLGCLPGRAPQVGLIGVQPRQPAALPGPGQVSSRPAST
jgi:hypothetical protein